MKADMEAMKEQMTIMMEAMMDMRKIMEVKVAAANTATKRDPTHQPVFNQESHLVSDVEGQGGVTGVTAYGPQYT